MTVGKTIPISTNEWNRKATEWNWIYPIQVNRKSTPNTKWRITQKIRLILLPTVKLRQYMHLGKGVEIFNPQWKQALGDWNSPSYSTYRPMQIWTTMEDLDLVINNLRSSRFIYRNHSGKIGKYFPLNWFKRQTLFETTHSESGLKRFPCLFCARTLGINTIFGNRGFPVGVRTKHVGNFWLGNK